MNISQVNSQSMQIQGVKCTVGLQRAWVICKPLRRDGMMVHAGTIDEPQIPKPSSASEQVSQTTPEKLEEITPSTYVDLPLKTLKDALFDSVKYVDRGVKSSREDRSEIAEYINQLEGKSPNPAPTEALNLLEGKWKLVYTSNPRFLTAINLPNVELGEIVLIIDTQQKTIKIDSQFKLPAFKTVLSVLYSYEVLSAKRWKIKFEKSAVEKPVVEENVALPQTLNLAGQDVDISQMMSPLEPVADQLLQYASQFLDQIPSEITLPQPRARENFVLTTYLDEDLRITKTSNGTVLVYVKVDSN